MNLKAIIVGGLVAIGLQFILAFIGASTFAKSEGGGVIILLVGLLIGSIIAGIKSIDKNNAWKNGVCAVALMEILFLFGMYLMDYYLIHEPFAIITITPIFLLIGAFGGFMGGKIRRE